jgi:hypothetical protein
VGDKRATVYGSHGTHFSSLKSCSHCPSHHDPFPAGPARRCARCCGGIRRDQTSVIDPEPFAPTCAQSPDSGPVDRRILFALDQTASVSPDCRRVQTIDVLEFSSRAGRTMNITRSHDPGFGKSPTSQRVQRPSSVSPAFLRIQLWDTACRRIRHSVF